MNVEADSVNGIVHFIIIDCFVKPPLPLCPLNTEMVLIERGWNFHLFL